ncbi:MAG: hypothetical protein AMS17_11695 [Spirochaetes bacterium DG_61]|nr:MAG: hypothetical protein AMS17_11695 [Spirochaetes bacterium DG_61]
MGTPFINHTRHSDYLLLSTTKQHFANWSQNRNRNPVSLKHYTFNHRVSLIKKFSRYVLGIIGNHILSLCALNDFITSGNYL